MLSMFQSYHFKQCLTISYAANYRSVKLGKDEIGVQFLTSAEMSTLIFENENLRNNILSGLEEFISLFVQDQFNRRLDSCVYSCLLDLEYLACSTLNTDWLERLIEIFSLFYFVDTKAQRTTMIEF